MQRTAKRHLVRHPAGRVGVGAAAALATAAILVSGLTAPVIAGAEEPLVAASAVRNDSFNGLADKPYMGWSSWSLQSTNYPGVNPDGPGSWISEKNILEQADAMAEKLKPFGYEYVNIDAGWQDGADEYGRPAISAKRFPNGIASVAEHVHGLGLKLGIYTVVGIGTDAYDNGTTPIYDAPGCTTADIVYPDLRKTNGWNSAYKINYASDCAQKYADSIADLFASWKVDFIKMDGVGPGSFQGGADHDNTEDVKAWSKAVNGSGRPMQYVISWALSHQQADVWKGHTNGWRIDTDVECYCDTIVRWDSSVKQRWYDVVQWIDDAGPGHWNNLDAVNVGVGPMDGLTRAERQSYMTLWAIESAPLFAGDDLTKLDAYGLSLLTNREVIKINQTGVPARPVSQTSPQQTWYAKNPDGTITVALFNLADTPAKVTARWSDVGLSGPARVRDVWKGTNLGIRDDATSVVLPAHGSQLLTLTPRGSQVHKPSVPTNVTPTAVSPTSVQLSWRPSAAVRGKTTYRVYDGQREVARVAGLSATVSGLKPSTNHTFRVVAVGQSTRSGLSSAVRITTPGQKAVTYQAESGDNVLKGTASKVTCSGCSGDAKIGNLGGQSSVTITGVTAPRDGRYLVTIAYVDGDVSRQGILTVNGDTTRPVGVNFPGTGDNDWDHAQSTTVLLQLTKGTNSIELANPDNMPDIDALTV